MLYIPKYGIEQEDAYSANMFPRVLTRCLVCGNSKLSKCEDLLHIFPLQTFSIGFSLTLTYIIALLVACPAEDYSIPFQHQRSLDIFSIIKTSFQDSN